MSYIDVWRWSGVEVKGPVFEVPFHIDVFWRIFFALFLVTLQVLGWEYLHGWGSEEYLLKFSIIIIGSIAILT